MPRLSKPDAALRGLILGKASLKAKLEALAGMKSPSETFLLELVSSPDTHSKLKLKATERLQRIRHTREVDEILAAESLRLGLSGPVTASPQKSIAVPVRETDGPKRDTTAETFTLAESPVEPKRIEPPVVCEKPLPAKVPAPAPAVDTATPADPQPLFILPRGSFISHDEQSRLLQLFRIVADMSKSATERRGARFQLDRVVAIPDAGRSLFAIYLLAMLNWLDRNPHQSIPEQLADNSPVMEPDADYEAFSFNFGVNQSLSQQREDERVRRQTERVNAENKGGGMWEGLPAI